MSSSKSFLPLDLLIERPTDDDPAELTEATLRLWQAFAPLAPERRRWALTAGVVETSRAGDLYVASGEVAVVVSGCLGLSAAGSDLAAEILGPGDLAAAGAPRDISGQWITPGEIYRVSLDDWSKSAGAEGLLHLLASADRRRLLLERRIVCATQHLSTARVADLFLAIQEAAQPPSISLSQERLGGMLGLRRTTVNASCRQLELQGASRTRRGQIRVVDAQALGQAACGCRHAGAPAAAASHSGWSEVPSPRQNFRASEPLEAHGAQNQ